MGTIQGTIMQHCPYSTSNRCRTRLEMAEMPKTMPIRQRTAFSFVLRVICHEHVITYLKTAHILPPLNKCLQTCRIKTGFGTFGSIKRRHPNNGCPFSFSGLVDFSVRLEGPCYTLLLLP